MPSGAMQKGSDKGKPLQGITVLIHCNIHTLLINTMIYIFDVNGGNWGRGSSPSVQRLILSYRYWKYYYHIRIGARLHS